MSTSSVNVRKNQAQLCLKHSGEMGWEMTGIYIHVQERTAEQKIVETRGRRLRGLSFMQTCQRCSAPNHPAGITTKHAVLADPVVVV